MKFSFKKQPEDLIREDRDRLEGIIKSAGVGTIELPEKFAKDLLEHLVSILKELEEAWIGEEVAEDEVRELEDIVTDLKQQVAALKGQNTKLKKRVEKLK